ncbi:MAG: hypothetical protein AB7F86_03825 [Bdellovibrionales bacterium]
MGKIGVTLISLFLYAAIAHADTEDQDNKTTVIQSYDFTNGEQKSQPNYILILFDVKKLNVKNAHGHVIFRQLRNRVRLEFESSEFPRGEYAIGVSNSCGTSPSQWTELHKVKAASSHLAIEKALPKASLREPASSKMLMQGQNVGLFRVKGKSKVLIDCKPIQ